MDKCISDRLEHHSLLLMTASMVGHVANYLFHLFTGRMLPESEYGLMVALFGAVSLILFPMTALELSLTRTVASLSAANKPAEISALLKTWWIRSVLLGLAGLALVSLFSHTLTSFFGMSSVVPLLLAGLIPVLNLLLTLSGAALQGLQLFGVLSFRSGLLYTFRAVMVGCLLFLGYTVAGSGLLAHVLGMAFALGISLWGLKRAKIMPGTSAQRPPVLKESLTAFPVLLAFSILMTADVVLIRSYLPAEVSGEFAQAATLARMTLWLPLPIAQVMFPKVVGLGASTRAQKNTLLKAMGYTMGLVLLAFGGVWIAGDLIFVLVFGQPPTLDQAGWLRGMGFCMALLGPVYVVLQFELARNRVRKLVPLCALSVMYAAWVWINKLSPQDIIHFLMVAAGLSLLTAGRALYSEIYDSE